MEDFFGAVGVIALSVSVGCALWALVSWVAALGAANCYISSMLVQAPNKREALKTLDNSVEIIRNLINQTPDCFFGNRPVTLN